MTQYIGESFLKRSSLFEHGPGLSRRRPLVCNEALKSLANLVHGIKKKLFWRCIVNMNIGYDTRRLCELSRSKAV